MRKIRHDCIYCGRPGRLCIFVETQTFYCYGCHSWGKVNDLPDFLRGRGTPLATRSFTLGTKTGPYGASKSNSITLPDKFRIMEEGDIAWKYLTKRNIEPAVLYPYVGLSRNYIIFPVMEHGILVYYIGRKIYGYGNRYHNAKIDADNYIFAPYNLKHDNNVLVLTEGIFDCLSIYQKTGLSTVAILGKAINSGRLARILTYCSHGGKFILFLDPEGKDKSVLSSNINGYLQLNRHRETVVVHPRGEKDPGDMNGEEIMEEIYRAGYRASNTRAAEE